MAKVKFPSLIHVSRQEFEQGDDELRVHEAGAFDTAFDVSTDCAIYKLVSVGQVRVSRTFVEKKRKA